MLMLRLQRIGKIKHPSYRLVVSEKSKDTQAKAKEILGIYNPALKDKVLEINKERVAYWLSVGAQTSPTVHNFLLGKGLVSGKKRNVVSIKRKKQAKAAETAK